MKKFKEYSLLTAATVILTAAVYFLKMPNGFATGGVTGLAIILAGISGLSQGLWILILNIATLVMGWVVLGKEVGIKTSYCTLLFTGLLQLLEILIPIKQPLTDQPLMELLFLMFLSALAAAILFKCSASSGGTDIIALILKKYTSVNAGKCLLIVEAFVALSAFFVFDVRTGLFSVMGLFIKTFLIDSITESFESCKYFVIVTSYPEKITEYILGSMHHGATVVRAQGAYTQDEKTVLHTVCRRMEAIRLQKKIYEIDSAAFVIITTSSEIIGRGFHSI